MDVRRKIANSSVLRSIDPKKVYDKVRSMWKIKPGQEDILQAIPKETVDDKIYRMFEDDGMSTNSVQHSTTDVSTLGDNRRIFTEEQINIILKQCKPMLDVGTFTKSGIFNHMSKIGKGKEILEQFDVEQIRTRLKYEKLKRNRKSKSNKR